MFCFFFFETTPFPDKAPKCRGCSSKVWAGAPGKEGGREAIGQKVRFPTKCCRLTIMIAKKTEPGTRRKANVLSGNFLYAVIYRFNILLKEILHQPESSNDCDCLNCLASYCPSTVHKTKKRMDVVSCGVMSFSLDRWSFCFWSSVSVRRRCRSQFALSISFSEEP